MTGKARRAPRDWGLVRKLPSGRYQASYLDAAKARRNAPADIPHQGRRRRLADRPARRDGRGHLA